MNFIYLFIKNENDLPFGSASGNRIEKGIFSLNGRF